MPVLYFHGAFGSRLEWPLGPVPAGLRVISLDRPGYGYSDPAAGRSLTAWAEDIEQFADALGLERFRIVAWSAGTPYAIACAAHMSARIARLDLAASFAPFLRRAARPGRPMRSSSSPCSPGGCRALP